MRRLRRPRPARGGLPRPRHPRRPRAPPPLRAPAPLQGRAHRRRRARPCPRRPRQTLERPRHHPPPRRGLGHRPRTPAPSASPTARDLPYARLLLATGAVPRRLPLASPRAAYLRTFDDALALRARLRAGPRTAIIGGGFIGLELAAAARQLGCPVTVIEAQPRLLQRLVPAPLAAALQAEHERHGVRILLGQNITEINDLPDAAHIRLADGATLEADLVIVGIGALPDTALAAAAGLALDNGIAADARLRTSDPLIFAAGDCASFPHPLYGNRRIRLESWRNAREQGALAGRNMAGRDEPHAAVPWFWTDQYDLGLQIAGLPAEGTETIRRDLAPDAFLLFHLDASGRLVAASGIGPGAAVGRDIRLAEMLIARRAHPPRDRLAAADTRLKSLLAS